MAPIKKFNQFWFKEEIDDYLTKFNVLVIIQTKYGFLSGSADIRVYSTKLGRISRSLLKQEILREFSGCPFTDALCDLINAFAEKWYANNTQKKVWVINARKGVSR